jgi:hypothetical protein
MSIVPIDPSMPPPPPPWPTFQTLKTAQCVVANIVLERIASKRSSTLIFNAPLRVWSWVQIYNKEKRSDEDCRNVVFDVASVVALFFTGGRKIAIALDVLSEIARTCIPPEKEERPSPFTFRPPLDCTIYENALICLGFTEEEAKNREVLDDRYLFTCRHQKREIEKARAKNSPFLNNLEKMHHEKQTAYRTLIERLHSEA